MKVNKNQILYRLLFIFLFAFGIPLLQAHPYFVSVCEMKYEPKTKSLNVSLRLFVDDLEKSLEDLGVDNLNLGEKTEREDADLTLKKYIEQELLVEIDQKRVVLNFLGKEVENDLCFIFLEAGHIEPFEKIKISNRVLFQSFPTQTNLVHCTNQEQTKSLLLSRNSPSGELVWRK